MVDYLVLRTLDVARGLCAIGLMKYIFCLLPDEGVRYLCLATMEGHLISISDNVCILGHITYL